MEYSLVYCGESCLDCTTMHKLLLNRQTMIHRFKRLPYRMGKTSLPGYG